MYDLGHYSVHSQEYGPAGAAAQGSYSTYRGILSGYSWVTGATLKTFKKPVFLTYSFPTSMPADDRASYPDQIKEWRPFSRQDKSDARAALKQWGDASGIRFLETKKDHGDIQFSWLPGPTSYSAFANYPSNYSPSAGINDYTYFYLYSGNIYMNTNFAEKFEKEKSFKEYILLHEIGHALGLKHSFDITLHNNGTMSSRYDSVKYSVMAYTSDGDTNPTKLAPFDLQAIRALYGDSRSDGRHVQSWHWNSKKEILTLKGKPGSDLIQGTGGKDVIHGNSGQDRLLGLSGDDLLSGGAGADVLIGGTGRDTFRFDDEPAFVDVILDFEAAFDRIQLALAAFPALSATGALPVGAFEIGSKSTTAATRILYDRDYTGDLFYDADGSGPAVAIKVASMQATLDVSAGHFLII